ncbi:hypothetical protein Ddye_010349 [Dipteronia dyeriana]|uniref:Uncharacterized protein n=1 Tax=Dipteronia dyeriana TaxID=168575 RepID=A0AAE0CN60_9ROSI|nr:hypothetical protein Ddye_010349 [Dipteronia dyeriana]
MRTSSSNVPLLFCVPPGKCLPLVRYGVFFQKHFQISLHRTHYSYRTSSIWHGIESVIPVLQENSRWIIGTGINVNLWNERWLAESILASLKLDFDCSLLTRVADFIKDTKWCVPISFADRFPSIYRSIVSCVLPLNPVTDAVVRENSSSGSLTMTAAYDISPTKIQTVVWCAPSPHWIKVNFDGLSKGNPSPTAYRAVLRSFGDDFIGRLL